MTPTERWNRAVLEIKAWAPSATMERAEGTRFNGLLAAWAQDDFVWSPDPAFPREVQKAYYVFLDQVYQVFVIEHDWAAAFAGATEDGLDLSDDGSVFFGTRLPYPHCVFEFQFSGRRVCLFVDFVGGHYIFRALVHSSVGWLDLRLKEEADNPALTARMIETVRSMAIALDAGIARSDMMRVAYKQSRAQSQRGQVPVSEYNVVRLARRSHAAPLPVANESEPGTHVRLHFRRGHWRHFETHKTWIRWTLVGDPDLGFIDKHYRL